MSAEVDVAGHPVTLSPCHPLIFLVGYRGTGKSTVAQLLAEKLGWKRLDLDEIIEERTGRTIKSLFAEEGEAGFRRREAALLEECCGLERHVIATGGGIVLADGNRQRMRASGLVIWLTAAAETIQQRLQADPATTQRRPPLTVGGLEEIKQLLLIREPLYREIAHLIVDADARRPPELVLDILSRGLGGHP